jgi:hypothetical protein
MNGDDADARSALDRRLREAGVEIPTGVGVRPLRLARRRPKPVAWIYRLLAHVRLDRAE